MDGDDFFVDLLFFNWQQVRFVVVELKMRKFDPRDAGQLGFYVALGSTQQVAVSRNELSPSDQATLPAEETVTRIAAEDADNPDPTVD
ncbi:MULTISPECIES: PDDEXK nuclease domain-containing protein [unclassified Rathayibacter]|uniref:PDDEXK nuclease domain-containing protein n=1 Tax=unclassified Rathayibacter TaxID=2609250 RepID=UPI0006FFA6E8|nr:PDDEXK nuclease domain-containing protein [Rathayibacter sp. Leaf294]KQQ05558.1 hypothetical protein ASF42_03035 [Rathayibacter sp. Leaf294]KQS13421.1 hypothetical protein ASG06_03050 [Rathayibacter sp. Leaf185]